MELFQRFFVTIFILYFLGAFSFFPTEVFGTKLVGEPTKLFSFRSKKDGSLWYIEKKPKLDPQLDCAIKLLAWKYSQQLLPHEYPLLSVFDALELGTNCNQTRPTESTNTKKIVPSVWKRSNAGVTFFVDAVKGSDSNPGSLIQPFQTIAHAIQQTRTFPNTQNRTIVLRDTGTFYLDSTLVLGIEDNNLIITNYDNESPIISAGVPLKISNWKPFKIGMLDTENGENNIYSSNVQPGQSTHTVQYYGKVNSSSLCRDACQKSADCTSFTWHESNVPNYANMCYFRVDGVWFPTPESGHVSGKKFNVYVADISNQPISSFTGLFVNDKRQIRARFPNANPETTGLWTDPTGYISSAPAWLPHENTPDAYEIHIESPVRNGTHFPLFQIGLEGPVYQFKPPLSYWGTKNPIGGGGATYHVPSGLKFDPSYFSKNKWLNASTGVVHAFHGGHWGNWMFEIDSIDYNSNQIKWKRGGFQEARGSSGGGEWYVENIFEELDAPGEWFVDNNKRLYYYPNGTITSVKKIVATNLERIFSIQGSQSLPVANIILNGLTFRETCSTYLSDYEVPSGGDASVHRSGTVFIEGAENITISNCLFYAVGGNALTLSNYVRNTLVLKNEFVWSGDSAIILLGSANLIDATDGNQPRRNKIVQNLVHEIGMFGKQTSPYFQSLACETVLQGNVMFNGPRAGINFNDGMGGGNLVQNNLLFNLVRETGDHGPFNSWDRQPYVTKLRDGTDSLLPKENMIHQNFIINNYHSVWPIDHDDGSCWYLDTFNFLIYGGYKNYLGHSKTVSNNLYVYPDTKRLYKANEDGSLSGFFTEPFCANSDGAQKDDSGWDEMWFNNTCIIGNPVIYAYGNCNPNDLTNPPVPKTSNNKFHVPQKTVQINCGNFIWNLPQYQAKGYDLGSSVSDVPTIDQIIQWGKQILNI